MTYSGDSRIQVSGEPDSGRQSSGGSSPTRPSTTSQQVRVPGVPAVLLDQVEEQPAQVGVVACVVAVAHLLVEATGFQGRGEPLTRTADRVVPRGVELLRGVVDGREDLGVVLAPRLGVPDSFSGVLTGQLPREGRVLDGGQVLEQAAEREGRRADVLCEAGAVQAVGLPTERRAQPVEGADEVVELVAREWWDPGGDLRHGTTVGPVPDDARPEPDRLAISPCSGGRPRHR